MSEKKKRTIHVKLHPVEFDRVVRMRGENKWKEWLLSLPDQFRTLTERVELYERRNTEYEAENEQLKERLRVLQEEKKDT